MLAFQYVFGHDNLARFASDIALVGEPSCVGDDGDEMDETDNETGTRRLFERRLILICVAVKPSCQGSLKIQVGSLICFCARQLGALCTGRCIVMRGILRGRRR